MEKPWNRASILSSGKPGYEAITTMSCSEDGETEAAYVVDKRILGMARRSTKVRKHKIAFESSVYSYGLVRPRVEPWSLHKARLELMESYAASSPVSANGRHSDGCKHAGGGIRTSGDVVAPVSEDGLPVPEYISASTHMPTLTPKLSFWAMLDILAFGLWPYMLLAMNHVLQLGVIYYIKILAVDSNLGTCHDTPFFARFCTLGTFTVVIVKDLYGTVNLGLWLWNCPREPHWEWLAVRRYSDGREEQTGITRGFALASWLLVILPKLAIGVLLGIFGGGYLLKSPSIEAVVLHTVTLAFIMNIDELMYELFTSAFDKELLSKDVDPIYITLRRYNGLEYYIGGWVRAAVVIAAAFSVYSMFC